MSSTRLALCFAALAFGCSQQPTDRAPRAATEPSTPTDQSAPDPATQLQSWIPTNGAPGAPHAAAPAGAPGAAPTAQGEIRGIVRETMNAAGYTYLRIDSAGTDRWVATTETPVAVGNDVSIEGGDVMSNFHSRTLNRTFESILFAAAVHVAGAPVVAAPAAGAPPVAVAPTAEAPSPLPPGARHGTVRETMNSGGYTYLRVDGDGSSAWIAVPVTTVAVGDVVDVSPGSEMPGFHSRTLDRTFDQITFAPGIRVVRGGVARPSAPAVAAPTAPGALPPGHPPIGGRAAPNSISH